MVNSLVIGILSGTGATVGAFMERHTRQDNIFRLCNREYRYPITGETVQYKSTVL